MITKKSTFIIVILFIITLTWPVNAQMSKDQTYSVFNQANEAFRQANAAKDSPQAERLYKNAILGFEKLTEQGQIKNPKLYYNLANAYLLKGDIGRAILNYRRAEKLDSIDTNIKKNLAFARSKRIDAVAVKTEKRVLQTLFFWHYDLSLKIRFLIVCIFFGLICLFLTAMIWKGKKASLAASTIVSAVITIIFLSSVIIASKKQKIAGVITADQVTALQGPGQNYSPSFKEPLHSGTEFSLIESRPGWHYIKLSDDSDCWIPETSGSLI